MKINNVLIVNLVCLLLPFFLFSCGKSSKNTSDTSVSKNLTEDSTKSKVEEENNLEKEKFFLTLNAVFKGIRTPIAAKYKFDGKLFKGEYRVEGGLAEGEEGKYGVRVSSEEDSVTVLLVENDKVVFQKTIPCIPMPGPKVVWPNTDMGFSIKRLRAAKPRDVAPKMELNTAISEVLPKEYMFKISEWTITLLEGGNEVFTHKVNNHFLADKGILLNKLKVGMVMKITIDKLLRRTSKGEIVDAQPTNKEIILDVVE